MLGKIYFFAKNDHKPFILQERFFVKRVFNKY